MSLSTLIPEARSVLTSNSALTALVPASNISFSQRSQGQQLPGIIMNIGTVEYEPTMVNAQATTTYRVDYVSYSDTAEVTSEIHEAVKAAVIAASSNNFIIRLFDEDYFVDVDFVHRSRVMVTFEVSTSGSSPSSINYVTSSLNGRVTANIRTISQTSISSTDFLADDYILYLTGTSPSVVIPSASSNQSRILGLYYAGTSGVATVTVAGSGTIDGISTYSLTTSSRFVEFMSVSESSTHSWKSQLSGGGGGGSDIVVRETSGNSNTATTLQFPDDSVTHDGSGKATISMLQGVVTEYGFDGGLTSNMFPNGLFGDIDQDGVVGAGDLNAVLGNFGNTASPTSDQVATSFSRAQSQISNGDSSFFQTSRSSSAQATVTAFTSAGHVVEYFEGINSAQGRGFVSNFLADTVTDFTVRRTMYISSTPFPTALSQMQQYPLGPYDNQAKSLIQTVVNAYINSVTGNGSVIILRTLISTSPDKLLDTYTGASAAYSVRLLDKDYSGNCIRIRRGSDDSETDIGFDSNGNLDTAAIATHCGSANGYVVTWYDQSGNSLDATQTTAGNQPDIYNGSAVLTENGKPAIKDGRLQITGFTGVSTGTVLAVLADVPAYGIFVIKGGLPYAFKSSSGGTASAYRLFGTAPNTFINGVEDTDLTDGEGYTAYGTSQAVVMAIGETSRWNNAVYIGIDYYGQNTFQELIIWDSSQSSNQMNIAVDINNYFQIGNIGTPTSGLLSTYTGAAAAYSIRQLSDIAVKCMRIRRDNDDAEQDIGFDSNGDLDTGAIASFVGSGNTGYLVKWYDQSSNSATATAIDTARQPEIYVSNAVPSSNGKPAVDFGVTNYAKLTATISSMTIDAASMFVVCDGLNGNWDAVVSVGGTSFGLYNTNNGQFGSNYNGTHYSQNSNNANQHLHALIAGSTHGGYRHYIDQTGQAALETTLGNTSVSDIEIGALASGSGFAGKLQEIIIWPSDQSSNQSNIETSLNNYYSIF